MAYTTAWTPDGLFIGTLLDRPSYVYAMTKTAFRDFGVMLHSGLAFQRQIAEGIVIAVLIQDGQSLVKSV